MKALQCCAVTLALFAFAPAAPSATTNIVDAFSTNMATFTATGGDGWIIRNGGVVSNGNTTLGGSAPGSFVLVTGTGSTWTNAGANFYMGGSGNHYNTLTVASNGLVRISTGNFNIGNGTGSSSNVLTVTDSGSLLSMAGARFGDSGSGNLVVVTNGGRIQSSGSIIIGADATGSFQSTLVSGSNSVLTLAGLTVGGASRSSSLTINDGGLVTNSIATLGVSASGSNATVKVTDVGSRWIGTGSLRVGQVGANASVLVTNGGYARVSDLFIGTTPTSFYNRVTVSGAGSLLDVASALRIGGSDGANPGGSSNSLFVLDGATVSNVIGMIGLTATSSNNLAVVAGNGSSWRLSSGLLVGDGGFGGSLVVTNGGVVRALGNVIAGNTAGASGNQILVSGAGSILEAAGAQITVGVSGGNSSIQILNGGVVSNGSITAIGSSSTSNLGVVAGAGSRWIITNNSSIYVGQTAGSGFNKLFVTNNGLVVGLLGVGSGGLGSNEVYIGSGGIVSNTAGNASLGGTDTHNNKVTISDPGSEWYVGGLIYLGKGNNNLLLVTNGGRLRTGNTIYIPDTSGTNNLLRVTGAGSYVNAGGGINWREGQFGRVEVLNGGVVEAPSHYILGSAAAFSNNTLLVSGAGSLVKGAQLQMHFSANNLALVTDGGTLDLNTFLVSFNSVVSNSGGVLQFPVAPTITLATGGRVYVDNGTISFRDTADAIAGIAGTRFTNFTFSGNNSFRLLSATNEAGTASYTVDTGSPTTTYQRLVLAGTNSAFRAGVLTIGSGGELYTSNSVGASIAALVTNSGTVRVYDSILTYQSNVVVNGGSFITRNATNQFNRGLSLAGNSTLTFTNGASRVTGVISNSAGSTIQALNSTVTFQDAVVIGGRYYSDPSTNTFVTNVTVTASGALYGSNGDLFVFNRDLTMASTNRAQFDLSYAGVRFDTGAGTTNHILNLAGSGALDKGSNWIDHTQLATNFSIGTLAIAAGNRLTLTGDKGSQTNALYVGWLDLTAWSTNALDLTNTLHAALSLDINLYYDKFDTKNAYLQGLEFNGWSGGGLLIPIPEPTAWMALGTGLALLAFLRRRSAA
jgi:T5SS/PEP-CTERM-associated repeat protein